MTPEKNRQSPQGSEIRVAIIEFALESEEEIIAMSEDDVDAALAEHGIDLESEREELQSRISTACKQARLTAARQERIEKSSHPQANVTGDNWAAQMKRDFPNPAALRAEVSRRVGSGRGNAAYFRRLEDATEEDLIELLRDLTELEEREDTE